MTNVPQLPAKIKDWASMLQFIRSKEGPAYLDNLLKVHQDIAKEVALVGKADEIDRLHADAIAVEKVAQKALKEAREETLAMKERLVGQIDVEAAKLKDAIEKWNASKRTDQAKLRAREESVTRGEEATGIAEGKVQKREEDVSRREERAVALEKEAQEKLAQIDKLVKAVS